MVMVKGCQIILHKSSIEYIARYIESKKRKDEKQNIKYNRKQDKTIGQASG